MKKPNPKRFFSLLLALFIAATLLMPAYAASPVKIELGSTSNFAVLAANNITNTGNTTISGTAGGDIGLFPGVVYGALGVTTTGTNYISDAGTVAALAQIALTAAYNQALGTASTATISADLGGMTLTPGVYTSGTGLNLNGVLTLDGQNDPNSVFIFKAGSTLTTGAASEVRLINGARFCRVFWQVGSSVTLGTNSIFRGHILAQNSITAATGAYVQGQLLARTGNVALNSNTIINDLAEEAATLTIINQVINDNTGIALPTDFTLSVKTSGLAGTDVFGSPQIGSALGTVYSLIPGNYVISKTALAGYNTSFLGADINGNFTLTAGENRVVTLINNDIAPIVPATLTIINQVINDNTGMALPADFALSVKTPGITGTHVAGSPQVGSILGNVYSLLPGNYVISETANAGYSSTFLGADMNGNITLTAGENRVVTLINNDIAPVVPATLTIIKQVINDNTGMALPADFAISVKTSGMTGTHVAGSPQVGSILGNVYSLLPGNYVISETANVGYSSAFLGADMNGNITLTSGENRVVTLINNDIAPAAIAPLINVVKTPSPLSLSSGSGLVTYTYRVTNPGVVNLSGVSVVDDKINTITYISGDTNLDTLLQPSETWVFTGSMTLYTTTTNRATAMGSGNGLLATDIAFATVVVTLEGQPPVYPPLVNIVKTASPLALLYGEGPVTYTYRVTNPGLVTLSNILVTDDKINTITYVSGDTNLDNLMQTGEIWFYTATDVLTETTVNTATVTARANGMISTDTSIATVIFTPAVITEVQPLINVVKTSSVSSLTGSANVIYTYRVTNPGTIVLNNVTLLDDKIALVVYQSGDLNNDALLQPGEAWVYKAETVLFKTTTNRATASGIGNNIVVYNSDDATVTVTPIVTQPPIIIGGVLPVTASPWYNLLLTGLMMMVLGLTGWIFIKVYE